MKPTHEGAERIVTDLAPFIDKLTADYQAVLPEDDGAIKATMSSNLKGGVCQAVTSEDIRNIREVSVLNREQGGVRWTEQATNHAV